MCRRMIRPTFTVILLILIIPLLTSTLAPPLSASATETESSTNPPFIKEYEVPTPKSAPMGIGVDNIGMVWFVESNSQKLAMFSPETETFTEYQIPTHAEAVEAWDIAFDRERNVWFPDGTIDTIWRFNPREESFEAYRLPDRRAFPVQIAFDREGQLWFTDLRGSRLTRLIPSEVENGTSKGITQFDIPTPESRPGDLVFDKDGNIWFTESGVGKVAMFNPRDETFTEYDLPSSLQRPVGIILDNQGDVWMTDHESSKFFKFNPHNQVFKEYATSITHLTAFSNPYYIIEDSQGNLWFNLHYGNRIATFNLESEVLTEYDIPTSKTEHGPISDVLQLALAPDGRIWFTEATANKIGVVDPSIPVPFTVSVQERTNIIRPGETVVLNITLKTEESDGKPITMDISGTTHASARLMNLTASFSKNTVISNGEDIIELTLKTSPQLEPGNYTLMVGGRQETAARYVAIEMRVLSEGGPLDPLLGLEPYLVTLLTFSIAAIVAVSFVVIRRRSNRRSSSPPRSLETVSHTS